MKPGDLRWFNASLVNNYGSEVVALAGCSFIVLEVKSPPAGMGVPTVKLLIDGRDEEGLSYFWVLENSEVISEAR